MTFDELLAQVLDLLQRQGRVSYRALKRRFALDDDYLEDIKAELIDAQRVAVDEDGKVLVCTGGASTTSATAHQSSQPALRPNRQAEYPALETSPLAEARTPDAERRQLTVLFCDLVDSTVLASQLDPEEWREVVRAYQTACAEVIQRFDGHIAQYLGDGLLVYFGYPRAHEDDAQRAIHTGLGMVEGIATLNTQLAQNRGIRLAVRVGIHTGLVVIGGVGGSGRQERLALGETPHVAARIQGLAAPDTVAVSATTFHLVQGLFSAEDLGSQMLKGVAMPVQVYRVQSGAGALTHLDVAVTRGLTPLVGRELEVALLLERWAQVKEGMGQVVVLSGEPGIGKSRLVGVLKECVAADPHTRLECRGSPYHQHSALYPVIDLLQQLLAFAREDTTDAKVRKLEAALSRYHIDLQDAVPLFASLLSMPLPDHYSPLTVTPRRQRQKTLETLLAMVLELAAQQPVLFIVEDLHWIDPSTLEFLTLLVDQGPTARLFTLCTCRPEFRAPWGTRAHLTPVTLNRLPRHPVETLVVRVAGDKALPSAVVQQVVAKTDGVPLFVEELTKMVLESGLLREEDDRYELTGPLPPLAIPTTLHDSLMARLDRLAAVKEVAQLGATLGRTFSYELLRAVSPLDEVTLQQALSRLVETEMLYQQGVPPRTTYLFKHALIQDAAYQSLLKSTRQRYHQRIAQVLAERFPETAATQPELLAHHYTEAGLNEQAIAYWQRAGQQALQRSANLEAVQHLTTGLALLATLPEIPARVQQELDLRMALGPALSATKGSATPEVEQTYTRARALCAQIGETPQLFPALWGLCRFYRSRGKLLTARELGEQLYRLAQHEAEPTHLLEVHDALGYTLFFLGEYVTAWTHLEQGIALIDPTAQRALVLRHGEASGVQCLAVAALTLWCLGYPAQAVRRSQEALALAKEIAHPYSLAVAQHWAANLYHRRREAPALQAHADALLLLATAQEFPLFVGYGMCWRGWALAIQGQGGVGLAQMHQGLAAVLATRWALSRPFCLVLLAEAAGHAGQVPEGLRLLAEALAAFEASGRGELLAEAYRLQGELLLRQAVPEAAQAEACFQQSLAVARCQQAKSWELRAAMSLARLWQQQGKRQEAYDLLAPIYGWFTEGFDTADLQEAKVLLEKLR
jgi:class 3 adenylate cyclase/predicted ATPase